MIAMLLETGLASRIGSDSSPDEAGNYAASVVSSGYSARHRHAPSRPEIGRRGKNYYGSDISAHGDSDESRDRATSTEEEGEEEGGDALYGESPPKQVHRTLPGHKTETRSAQVPLEIIMQLKQMVSELTEVVTIQINKANKVTEAIMGRLKETEDRLSVVEDQMAPALKRIATLERKMQDAQIRIEEQEGRARRSNIRVVGVPEGLEGSRPEEFLEKLITDLFPKMQLSKCFTIERAHRSLQPRPAPNAPPRTMIAKVLNYRDRDSVLTAAREMGVVKYREHKICFFPDYTLQVQALRKKFEKVKKELWRRHVKYSIMFLAKLRFTLKNKTHFFTDSELALEFVLRNMPLGEEIGRQSNRLNQNRTKYIKLPNPELVLDAKAAAVQAVKESTVHTIPTRRRRRTLSVSMDARSMESFRSAVTGMGPIGDWIMSSPLPCFLTLTAQSAPKKKPL